MSHARTRISDSSSTAIAYSAAVQSPTLAGKRPESLRVIDGSVVDRVRGYRIIDFSKGVLCNRVPVSLELSNGVPVLLTNPLAPPLVSLTVKRG